MTDQPLFERHLSETRQFFNAESENNRRQSVDLQRQSASFLEQDQVAESDMAQQQAVEARRKFGEIGAFIIEDLPRLYEDFNARVNAALVRRNIVLSSYSSVFSEHSPAQTSAYDFQADPTAEQLKLIMDAFGSPPKFALSDEEYLAPVDLLELQTRAHNGLLRSNISTIGSLINLKPGPAAVLKNIGNKGESEIITQMFHFGVVPVEIRGDNPTQLPIESVKPEIWQELSRLEHIRQIASVFGKTEFFDLPTDLVETPLKTFLDPKDPEAEANLERSGLQTVGDLLAADRSVAVNTYRLWSIVDQITNNLVAKGIHPKDTTKVNLPHGGYIYKAQGLK